MISKKLCIVVYFRWISCTEVKMIKYEGKINYKNAFIYSKDSLLESKVRISVKRSIKITNKQLILAKVFMPFKQICNKYNVRPEEIHHLIFFILK